MIVLCMFVPLQHLLINIGRAVCRRLDVIDDQLEAVCQSTQYLDHQLQQLLRTQGTCWKNTASSQWARKRRYQLPQFDLLNSL